MMSCWELLPEQRPSFSDLTELLLIMFDDSECHVSVVCRDSDQQTFAVEIVDLLPTSVKVGIYSYCRTGIDSEDLTAEK